MNAGDRFGKLVFCGEAAERATDGHRLGVFRCDCGKQRQMQISRVKHGRAQSCGCWQPNQGTHRMRKSPEYRSWVSMIGRCHSPTNKDYPRWGARGIVVCPEWRDSFAAFYAHIGRRPAGTSLDRIDNAKGYEPGNVRWATAKQQAQNRAKLCVADTPRGRMPVVDYGRLIGISPDAARLRLRRGKLAGCTEVSP